MRGFTENLTNGTDMGMVCSFLTVGMEKYG